MIPKVEGNLYHFEYVGLYNGLALIRDRETNSFWSHYTGECLHGPHQGYQPEVIAPIQFTTAAQALKMYPDASIALAQQTFFARFFSWLMQRTSLTAKGAIPPHFYKTMAEADDRRPRLDIGLGITDGNLARYYPLEILKESSVIVDQFNDQNLVIYIDPVSQIPSAFYSDASTAHWEADTLHLDTGEMVRDGQLYSPDGDTRIPDRPTQQFARWYGFSYTFPNCEIFMA